VYLVKSLEKWFAELEHETTLKQLRCPCFHCATHGNGEQKDEAPSLL